MALIDMLNSIGQEAVDGMLNESLYERAPTLALLVGRGMSDMTNGRPGAQDLVGAMRPRSASSRGTNNGSPKREVKVQKAKFGGGKGVAYRDTAGSVTTLDTIGALEVPWTLHNQPIKVAKDDFDSKMNSEDVFDVLAESVEMGVKEIEELVSISLLSGNPASQTATQLTEYVSFISALDLDLNATYLNSADRTTTDTFLQPALYHDSTVKNFTWGLIDDINAGTNGDNNNPNGGAQTLGKGVDYVISNSTLFYQTILPLARADGHQIITSGGMQDIGLVGFKRPVVKYMDTLITFDPHMPANGKNGTSKSYLLGLTLDSWGFESHSDNSFTISAWTDIQPATRERAFQADIELKGRLWCKAPARNGLFGNVD